MSKRDAVERTSSGLRDLLFDEIERLVEGDSTPAKARSMAALANAALKSVEVEIEWFKYVSPRGEGAVLGSLSLSRQKNASVGETENG